MALAQPQARALPEPASRRLSLLTVAIGVLIVGVVCLTTARFLTAPLDRFDEGVTLTKAWLLSVGEVPYRDFWATYGPFDTVVLAALFKLIAPDVLVERVLATVSALAFMGCAFATLSALGVRGALRWLMSALLSLVPLSIPAFNSAVAADLVALVALFAFTRSLAEHDWRWTAAAGGFTGLASFARPELGLALVVALLAGGIARALNSGRWHQLTVLLGSSAIAAGVLWLPTMLLAGSGPIFLQLVRYPLTLYPLARSIPLGQGPEGGAALVMAVASALVWAWALVRLFRRGLRTGSDAMMLTLLVGGVLLFTWVRTRADGAHALTAWPPTCLLLAMLMAERRRGGPPPRRLAEAIVSLAALASVLVADLALVGRDLARPAGAWDAVPGAAVVGARSWMAPQDLGSLIRQVDASVPADQPIFVGLQSNSQVVFNDTTLYFLTRRRPPSVYYEFLPGFTNSSAVEAVLICALNRTQTSLAILGPNTPGEPWNASSRTGSSRLDRWIAGHTVSAEAIGPYLLVRLHPDPVPGSCPEPPF